MTDALDALERRISSGAVVADLVDLVAIPSVTGTPAEGDATVWLADRLRALGADVDHWEFDLDELRAHPDHPGEEADREQGWGAVGSWGRPRLILAGHLDVVPPGDAWAGDPFEAVVSGGRLTGRGACDMKAGVVAMLAAATALAEAGVADGLALHGLIGEEDGGLGAFATLQRGHGGDVCVIPEPTAGRVLVANAGALTFRLTVPGRSAHGSTRYEGVDPIEKFAVVYAALRRLETVRNAEVDPLMAGYPIAYPLAVGVVRAGDWASTVPDTLVAEGRYGVALGEDPAAARSEFEAAVAEVDPAVRVEWWGGQFASGRLPHGHPLLGRMQDAVAAVNGVRPDAVGAPYGSDLRHYAAAGIPTLQWGPGDVAQAHTADEWVSVDALHEAARVFTRLGLS